MRTVVLLVSLMVVPMGSHGALFLSLAPPVDTKCATWPMRRWRLLFNIALTRSKDRKRRGGQITVQGTISTEAVQPAASVIKSAARADSLIGRWAKSGRRALVTSALVSSDVLLAFAMWQAAFMLQAILGRGPLSDLALASLVPAVALWVGLRTVTGLYPGYGLGTVEELRRQMLALFATVAIITVFAFAYHVGGSLSRMLLLGWCLGLLVLAPLVRYFVKRAIIQVGFWGKPVVVLGAEETGAHVLKVLRRERHLGFNPIAVFDNRLAPTGGALEGVPYGGTMTDAAALGRRCGVDTAIFAMPHT